VLLLDQIHSNVILLQGVLAAINMMTQVSAQSDQHNVHMAQQQMQLQAATLWSNAQQLANLGSYMSNIRKEVGKMIANNPTQSMIHVTISQPNAGKFIDRLGLWQVRTAPISYPLLPASPIQSRTEDRLKSLVTNHSCTQKEHKTYLGS